MTYDKIISRYQKALHNISELLEICDILHVYDNTLEQPVRIMRKHKEELMVFPNELWSEEMIEYLIR